MWTTHLTIALETWVHLPSWNSLFCWLRKNKSPLILFHSGDHPLQDKAKSACWLTLLFKLVSHIILPLSLLSINSFHMTSCINVTHVYAGCSQFWSKDLPPDTQICSEQLSELCNQGLTGISNSVHMKIENIFFYSKPNKHRYNRPKKKYP